MTRHHAIPDPLGAPPQPGGVDLVNATGGPPGSPATVTTTTASMGWAPGTLPLALFLAVIVALAILALIGTRGVPGEPSPPRPGGGGWEPGLSYAYRGVRRELRRVFLAVRGRIEARLGRSLSWATAREIASLDPEAGLEGFADLYSRAMYAPGEPGEWVVEEARRRAGLD